MKICLKLMTILQFSSVKNDITKDDLLLEVSKSETKHYGNHNPLFMENSKLIKM